MRLQEEQKQAQEYEQTCKQQRKQRRIKQQQRTFLQRHSIFKNALHYIGMAIMCIVVVIFALASIGNIAYATGLVDETINANNEYSRYALSHYQLDFYVDNSWGWLPWNWSDGLGKSVMYGLYAITNFIWIISLYLSNATGYLVGEAYSLDFISQTSNAIGQNMQTIAGITRNGFSSTGFYVGFLLIFVLILGVYVTYTGLIKRETTKAVQAILNFVIVFILSASFIAYAPDYISRINDFSKDISNASLDVGTRIVIPNSNTQGQNSVDMIRDSLFAIQVKQPWLLLQYGSTDIDNERVENLLSVNPDTNNGKDREDVVISEIENMDNTNLTITKTISRLGTVFFLFIFNIGISTFVFLLTGIMIFSQVLFIIFAMFLPISFLLSMIPSFEGMGKRAIMRLFNVIMTRAGITLIITVTFSISAMLYSLAGSSPFFMVMFLQIVTFAGIYFKLGDLMGMFALQSGDSENMGKRMLRKPRMLMHRQARRLQRSVSKAFGKNPTSAIKQGRGANAGKDTKAKHERSNGYGNTHDNADNMHTHGAGNTNGNGGTNRTGSVSSGKHSLGKQMGEKIGHAMDTKNRIADKAIDLGDNIKNAPTNAKYAMHKGKRNLVQSMQDFSQSTADTREKKKQERATNRNNKRAGIAQKRLEMDRARKDKDTLEPRASMRKNQQAYANRQQAVTSSEVKPSTQARPSSTHETKAETKATRPSTYHHKAQNQSARAYEQSPKIKTPLAKESTATTQRTSDNVAKNTSTNKTNATTSGINTNTNNTNTKATGKGQ